MSLSRPGYYRQPPARSIITGDQDSIRPMNKLFCLFTGGLHFGHDSKHDGRVLAAIAGPSAVQHSHFLPFHIASSVHSELFLLLRRVSSYSLFPRGGGNSSTQDPSTTGSVIRVNHHYDNADDGDGRRP